MSRIALLSSAAQSNSAAEFLQHDIVRNWNSFSLSSQFRGRTLPDLLDEETDLTVRSGGVSGLRTKLIALDFYDGGIASPDFYTLNETNDANYSAVQKSIMGQARAALSYYFDAVSMVAIKACSVTDVMSRDVFGRPSYFVHYIPLQEFVHQGKAQPAH